MTRGRGNNGGNGGSADRGRGGGRGGPSRGRGRGGGGGRGRDAWYRYSEQEIVNEVQELRHVLGLAQPGEALPAMRGRGGRGFIPRGGRGRGSAPPTPSAPTRGTRGGRYQGLETNRGYGRGRGSGNGRGRGGQRVSSDGIGYRRPDADAARRRDYDPREGNPFLKPIIFVKSTTVLFKEEEEIFAPEIADDAIVDPDTLPAVHRIEEAFYQAEISATENQASSSSSDEEAAEENDEADMLEVETSLEIQSTRIEEQEEEEAVEALIVATASLEVTSTQTETHPLPFQEPLPLFVIDGEGDIPSAMFGSSRIRDLMNPSSFVLGEQPSVDHNSGLAEDDIVLVPIRPKPSTNTPILPASHAPAVVVSVPTLDTIQFSFSSQPQASSSKPRMQDPRRRKKEIKKLKRGAKKRKEPTAYAGLGWVRERKPQDAGSDLDWGSDGPPSGPEDIDEEDGLMDPLGGMTVDPELSDINYTGFMRSLAAGLGDNAVTIDDVEDINAIAREDDDDDEDEVSESTQSAQEMESGGEEDVMAWEAWCNMQISDHDDDNPDSSDDDDGGGEAGFKARLAKLRAKGKGKAKDNSSEELAEEGLSGDVLWGDHSGNGRFTWENQDEAYLEDLEMILDKNADLLESGDRTQKKRIFKAVDEGNFDYLEVDDINLPAGIYKKGQKKGPPDYLPVELHEQWIKDRSKKAENKRLRKEARALEALNPFKTSKSQKKALKKLAKNAAEESQVSRPIVNLFTLEAQIRVYLNDIGNKSPMTLPPMDKESRRRVHLLAQCFNLKSQSRGGGVKRYPTLHKTSMSGLKIDEKAVTGILSAAERGGNVSGGGIFTKSFNRKDEREKSAAHLKAGVKHREGDIVGQHAAKIGEGNIGYKLLQSMGWAEGDRIGVTGGLANPLMAVIKNTKLGLGASRS